VIVIDTDLLAIYHLFTHDPRSSATGTFMEITRKDARGTTLYNLMELAGIVAAAGKAPAARQILETYAGASDMKVLYPALALATPELFWTEYCAQVLAVMERGVRYGDAKILWVAESNDCSAIITWNTAHYRGRTPLSVMTPEEYCAARESGDR
jgi:predicted nucleic acid-binding protein